MHCVLETKSYVQAAKDVGLSEEDNHKIVTYLAENPEAGDLIKGTGGARKVRFPFRNKGKSGGVRIVTYYCDEDVPVFLLDVFSKGDRINLSKAERNELKGILSDLAQDYREKNNRKIAALQEKTA